MNIILFLLIIVALIVFFFYIMPCILLVIDHINSMIIEGRVRIIDILFMLVYFVPIINLLLSMEIYEHALGEFLCPLLNKELWTRKEKE